MPYTNAWSNSIPAGSVAASLIDDHIRQLRLDINERMDDLVGNWATDDPVEPKTGIVKAFHWSLGSPVSLSIPYAVDGTNTYLRPLNSGSIIVWQIHLLLPVGVTLQEVRARVFRGSSSASVGIELYRTNLSVATPAAANMGSSLTSVIGSWSLVGLSSLAHVVLANNAYFVSINLAADSVSGDTARLAGIEIIYDRTHALQGI